MYEAKAMQNQVNDVYLKVVRNFPNIKPEEIEVMHLPATVRIISIVPINPIDYMIGQLCSPPKEARIRPTLVTGNSFLKLKREEQEAAIAHEIGHYCHTAKNLNPKRIRRHMKSNLHVNEYIRENPVKIILSNLTKEGRARNRRLKKISLLNELYADSKAAEAGYGEQLYKLLKDMNTNVTEYSIPVRGRIELKERIKNLEKILQKEKQ